MLVREQLSLLPPRYRIVLALRHLQGMTHEEMVEILAVPVGTIKTHLFRARNLLKKNLEASGYVERLRASPIPFREKAFRKM
ncbi:MAG: hypothetical protein IMW89_05060 [Ktedonobacteraceae bacterium]|nr:hypothetical protein [Ktedonobacteraceae bacterium]